MGRGIMAPWHRGIKGKAWRPGDLETWRVADLKVWSVEDAGGDTIGRRAEDGPEARGG
jgi:hypothetical protein